MIDRETLEVLAKRADKACKSGQAEDGLELGEVVTVLGEYKEALDLLDLAAAEGFRTPIQKELDIFLDSHPR